MQVKQQIVEKMCSYQHQKRNGLKDVGLGSVAATAKGALAFLFAIAAFSVYDESKLLRQNSSNTVKLRIPSSLDESSRRQLSLNLGNGKCLWQVRFSEPNNNFTTTAYSQILTEYFIASSL
jgi:hypothetical protein